MYGQNNKCSTEESVHGLKFFTLETRLHHGPLLAITRLSGPLGKGNKSCSGSDLLVLFVDLPKASRAPPPAPTPTPTH